ncbi:MAG: hypothetical protein V3U73_06165 [bacterium]
MDNHKIDSVAAWMAAHFHLEVVAKDKLYEVDILLKKSPKICCI